MNSSDKMDNKHKGKRAEKLAADFYLKHGYSIKERNYRHSRGEIDLIVTIEFILVFVEVKFRTGSSFGYPEEFVSQNQQRSIITTAEHYIVSNDWNKNIRFDIIAIDEHDTITHFEDAFY